MENATLGATIKFDEGGEDGGLRFPPVQQTGRDVSAPSVGLVRKNQMISKKWMT